jgi:hypothetical protein
MSELEQLRELVFNNRFFDEDKDSVLQWEQKLHEISVKENILAHRPVKDWFDWMKREVTQARLELSTDESLTQDQRTELFTRIKVANKFLSLLDLSDKPKIEAEIKNALNVAKNQIAS